MQVANICSAIKQTVNLYFEEFLQANWTIDLCPHSASFLALLAQDWKSTMKKLSHLTTSCPSSIPLRTCIHSQYLSVQVNKYFDG